MTISPSPQPARSPRTTGRSPRTERLRALGLLRTPATGPAVGEALRRARLAQRRRVLGPALAAGVATRIGHDRGPHLARGSQRLVVGAAFSALLVSMLILCVALWWQANSLTTLLALGTGCAAAVLLLMRYTRHPALTARGSALPGATASAAQFDAFITTHIAHLPDEAVNILGDIKTALLRLLPAMQGPGHTFGADDIGFVNQTISRYIPDALVPYRALVAPTISDNHKLHAQLALVSDKLAAIAAALDATHAERLTLNHRFLERKLSQ